MTDGTVRHEREGHISIVTLERTAKRNAINADLAAAIDAAFNEIDDDPDIWVAILTGGPDVFCAGTDLAAGPGKPTQRGGEYGIIRRRRTKPLIAAVEGVAFGGGFEIAIACDMVVAARNARFALPEVRRGVIANSGALFRATRALPPAIAKELLLTGAEISPETLLAHGMVNRVVDPGDALAEAMTLAELIASNAPISVQHTLMASDRVLSITDEIGWDATAEGQRAVMASDDCREGVAAFLEKRQPEWTGR
ncbi:MAG: enoyl-CoA hydratase/isomerase family protein [Acidobacteria bacterium]|nr:enoyl-CoA hydratase/isomerase family protein [Acidobacteriota bacterium]